MERKQEINDFVSTGSTVRTDKTLIVKDYFTVDDVNTVTNRGRKINVTRGHSAYTALLTDTLIVVPSVAVAPTITLPEASTAGIGKVYMIKDISGSAAATSITISRSGTDTINGDTSTSINTNYGFVGLFSDGSNWFVQ